MPDQESVTLKEHGGLVQRPAGEAGIGYFTTTPVMHGKLLLVEPLLFAIQDTVQDEGFEGQVLEAYEKLSRGKKKAYIKLKENSSRLSPESEALIEKNPIELQEYKNKSKSFQTRIKCRIVRIFLTNLYVLPNEEGKTQNVVFLRASRFNNSCTPNAHVDLCEKSRTIYVHSVMNLKKGDEVRISYTNYLLSHASRREQLGFDCDCKTCKSDHREASDARRGRLSEIIKEV
ncbi:hypothetical protein F4803DRAFT_555391 [Xylaria telfairii]|nr:hypothetical protein F4803DRAFT_555391 [Xylaria telfairii]